MKLTQEKLKELYFLNEDGEFIGKIEGRKTYGKPSGNRYRGIQVGGVSYSFDRLRTLYRTGILPPPASMSRAEESMNRNDAMRDMAMMRWI